MLSRQAEAAAIKAAATVSSLENDLNLSRKDTEVQEQERRDYREEMEVRRFENGVGSEREPRQFISTYSMGACAGTR